MRVTTAAAAFLFASTTEAFTLINNKNVVRVQNGQNTFVSKIDSALSAVENPVKPPTMLPTSALPEKLYFKKEAPKVLGGIKIGTRELVVVTGASSGLGRSAASVLAKTGRYFVVMACRDVEKGKAGMYWNMLIIYVVCYLQCLLSF